MSLVTPGNATFHMWPLTFEFSIIFSGPIGVFNYYSSSIFKSEFYFQNYRWSNKIVNAYGTDLGDVRYNMNINF